MITNDQTSLHISIPFLGTANLDRFISASLCPAKSPGLAITGPVGAIRTAHGTLVFLGLSAIVLHIIFSSRAWDRVQCRTGNAVALQPQQAAEVLAICNF